MSVAVEVGAAVQPLVVVKLVKLTTLLPTVRKLAGTVTVNGLVWLVKVMLLPFTLKEPLKGPLPEVAVTVTCEGRPEQTAAPAASVPFAAGKVVMMVWLDASKAQAPLCTTAR